jgi:hypothetical protein
VIDWAARNGAIGAGVQLMKHVGRRADFLLGVGGSKQTLAIMPLIGYRPCGVVAGYVRALSPVGLLRRPGRRRRWKLVPRLARSIFWSLTAPRGEMAAWRPRRIGLSEIGRITPALPDGRQGVAVFERSEALFSHLLACPVVSVELHALEKAGRVGGYFLLSYAPGQARLADAWMDSEDPRDWQALLQAAVRQAKRQGGLAELVTWSSDPILSRALEQCGFHEQQTLPIYLRSSGGLPIPKETVRVQMVENDAFYLYSGQNELWA